MDGAWIGCGWAVDRGAGSDPGGWAEVARTLPPAYVPDSPVLPARIPPPRRTGAARALCAAALAALLGGCTFLRAVTGVGLQRPTLTYESWSPEQLDDEGVTIALHYRLDNPNDFSLDLRRLDYRLEVEGQQAAQGELPGGVQLRADGPTPITFPIRLRWRDIPGLVQVLLTRREVSYRVTGTAGIGSELGMVALPFSHSDRLALPRLPPVGRIDGTPARPRGS